MSLPQQWEFKIIYIPMYPTNRISADLKGYFGAKWVGNPKCRAFRQIPVTHMESCMQDG